MRMNAGIEFRPRFYMSNPFKERRQYKASWWFQSRVLDVEMLNIINLKLKPARPVIACHPTLVVADSPLGSFALAPTASPGGARPTVRPRRSSSSQTLVQTRQSREGHERELETLEGKKMDLHVPWTQHERLG